MCGIERTGVRNRLGAVAIGAVAAERRNVAVVKAAAAVTLHTSKRLHFVKIPPLWRLFICARVYVPSLSWQRNERSFKRFAPALEHGVVVSLQVSAQNRTSHQNNSRSCLGKTDAVPLCHF
eukprot:COSAG06_NODE_35429_length_460_cov_0.850416_1_plen_120_part_10